jgi:hypothetical protein
VQLAKCSSRFLRVSIVSNLMKDMRGVFNAYLHASTL